MRPGVWRPWLGVTEEVIMSLLLPFASPLAY
jgi:hypothetical protein